MPSTYAHYRMGQEVREALYGKEKKIVDAHTRLYNIGLHGPDILFYYHPLWNNSVNKVGYGLHERTGREFFHNAKEAYLYCADREAHLAYIYGVLCHFALDMTCHGYVEEKIQASGVSHGEIEVEFDRELMLMDGYDPITHPLTNHIFPTEENAEVIHDFYKGVNASQVQKALKGMIFNNRLLLAPSKVKRGIIYTLLRFSGNYKEMHGLIVNYEKNPACNDSTKHLLELYEQAKQLAVQFIIEYQSFLSEETELSEQFDYTFSSKLFQKEKMEELTHEVQTN